MTDKIFIDTNIFVYAYTADDKNKNEIACNLLRENVVKNNIFISTQIINEFYSVMTKYKHSHGQIEYYVKEITEQTIVSSLDLKKIERCFRVKEKYGYSWWDSLVLTSALEDGCSILYSEDLQNGQIIENWLKIVNPFM